MKSRPKSPRSTDRIPMTPEEITAHLRKFRDKQERIASEERARFEREEAIFDANRATCRTTLEQVVEPLLRRLSGLLEEEGHTSLINATQETGHTTERTKLRCVEYAASIEVEQEKGRLILRVVANPQNMQIGSLIGVPHGTCSSVFHITDGPMREAGEVTNRGISDFMISAFPLR